MGRYHRIVFGCSGGFFSKYDEKLAVVKEIAEKANNKTQTTINGEGIKL